MRKAKRSIVLIDNYVDDTVLTLLDKRENGVTQPSTHNVSVASFSWMLTVTTPNIHS